MDRDQGTTAARRFMWLATATGVAAGASVVAVGSSGGWSFPVDAQYWTLMAMALAFELLPIRLPRQNTDDLVTLSSAFALTALFLFGALPAMLLWAACSFAADTIGRLAPIKAAFNASQYCLSMVAAAVTLHLAGGSAPLALTPETLPPLLVAAAAFFVVNHVLAGVGVATLTGARIPSFLRADLALLGWTAGFQLALAPMLLAIPGGLVLLGGVPILAIYLGGRQAAAANHRASHDSLTGLPGRGLFHARLGDALAQGRRQGRATWVALLDLNDFKSINDTLGHSSGDVVLRHVASRLREVLRTEDALARLGGDEFAIVLADADRASAQARAQRVIDGVGQAVPVGRLQLRVSASVGLASAGPCESVDAEELLRRADIALYEAKQLDGRTATYSKSATALAGRGIDAVSLGTELAHALDHGDIQVHLQPKVAANPQLAPAMEALARWRHPQLGAVDPAAFIAVAEQTGMIRELTERVLDLALERCAQWRRRGVPLRICVNLSPRSLVDESLPTLVSELLTAHGVPGEALQFEVTETASVTNVPRSRAVLTALRRIGATLAIDDFGTGFSSLSQLQALDLEEIKIDRSFVMAMEHDPQAALIVRSVVNLAHSLELRVCAEGVETPGAMRALQDLGCDYLQGYLFARPAADAAPIPALGDRALLAA